MKAAIQKAIDYPWCIDPLKINEWTKESLSQYDKRLAKVEHKLIIKTYLEGSCRY